MSCKREQSERASAEVRRDARKPKRPHLQSQSPEPATQLLEIHLVAPAQLQPSPNALRLAHHKHVPSPTRAPDVQRSFDTGDDLLEPELEVDGKLKAFEEGDVGGMGAEGGEMREGRGERLEPGDEGGREDIVLRRKTKR
jgi:hypothetical protein